MKALDLFCGAGGASAGLAMAGFEVIGVDIAPQPNYPYEFVQADVMDLHRHFYDVDLVWASPPCQAYSDLAKRNGNGHEWPQLIDPIRARLKDAGRPYVIENVEGAPLINPVRLCGTQFKSLRVLRHRLFEASFPITDLPHGKHPKCHTFDKRKAHFGKTCEWKDFVQVTGGGNSTTASAANAMGIWWMTKEELNEAIPPAYAFHVARCFMKSSRTQPGVSDVPVRLGPTTAPDSSQSKGIKSLSQRMREAGYVRRRRVLPDDDLTTDSCEIGCDGDPSYGHSSDCPSQSNPRAEHE